MDSSAKGYKIIKSTPFEIILCHGGGEGGVPLVKVYYFNPFYLCYMFFFDVSDPLK